MTPGVGGPPATGGPPMSAPGGRGVPPPPMTGAGASTAPIQAGLPRSTKQAPKMYNPATTGRPLKAKPSGPASTAGIPDAFAGGTYATANTPGVGAGGGGGAAAAYGGGAYPAGAATRPPPLDESKQCFPRFMQLTTRALPSTSVAAAKSGLPLAVTVHPMAEEASAPALPLVNFGTAGVVRCGRCRAYIHPFVHFINGGRQWRCSMCGKLNDVPSVYYCPLDESGQRTDLGEHPELTRGSVEIVAPAEYMVRPPQAPVYMFVIDVSHQAVDSGMLQHAVSAIKKCITEDLLPGGERTQIGFITYDSAVHFYNLKSTLASAQMLVVSDITDLFLPIPDELLVNLSDSRIVVEKLLDTLPEMFASTRNVESAMGPAVEAAYKVMRHIGGKMVVMQSSLPSLGAGRLRHRENPKMFGGDLEHTLLAPGSPYYKNIALEFSKQQISVDMYLATKSYTDVATLSQLSRYTAGQTYHYPGFNPEVDGPRLHADMVRDLSRTTGFEAVMRVRCTKGLRVTNFHGNFFIRGTDLLALPNVTADTACTVELEHVEVLNPATLITIQAALLYTSSSGERRICVHTMACTVTAVIADLFRRADVNSVCNALAKLSLDRACRVGFSTARVWLHRKCVDIVRAYRVSTMSAFGAANQQQEILPDNLKLLPLYTMALEKSPMLRGGNDISSDVRAALMFAVRGMSCNATKRFLHPSLYPLHNLAQDECLPVEPGATLNDGTPVPTIGRGLIKPPKTLGLSAATLTSDGMALLDDGVSMYLWIGRAVAPVLLNSLFGVPSLDGVDCSKLQVTLRDNDFSRRVNALLEALREQPPQRPSLRVVRAGQNDMAEIQFLWRLIEDPASYPGGKIGYKDFYGGIHRESQQAAPAPGTAAVNNTGQPGGFAGARR